MAKQEKVTENKGVVEKKVFQISNLSDVWLIQKDKNHAKLWPS